ncbi:MAG: uracil-DNA glycosylase family protein [Pirellulales bacterium]
MADQPQPDVDFPARRMLLQKLESLQRAGVTHLPRWPRAGAEPAVAGPPSPARAAPDPPSGATAASPPSSPEHRPGQRQIRLDVPLPPSPPGQRAEALEAIRRQVAACTRCEVLCAGRTQTVFGVGDPEARLCFLGEAPGADEDRQGEPFVGRAGQLLNKIIEACTLSREQVYILNTLKCRPPDNRNPLEEELANCREFLDAQLRIIQPQFICCLGAVAAQALLGTTASIGRLRKRFHDYQGSRVICTYHPAYLLRNPSAKKDVWEDMQMLMQAMGLTVATRAES